MQVGEQHLVLAQAGVFLGDGFFDLQEQVGGVPYLVGGLKDLGACGFEVFVGEGRADAGAGFDDDFVAAFAEFVDTGGADGHAVFVVLDFAGDADLHESSVLSKIRLVGANSEENVHSCQEL